jgi:hypothetical protein
MKRELACLSVMVSMSSVLSGCHDKDRHTDSNVPVANYTLSGTVSGLSGTGLVLSNNGVNLPISSGATFAFAQPLSAGAAYSVAVVTQPSSPAQVCTIANGSGTANANVGNVSVTCANVTYTISGTVSGLSGAGLELTNNGVDLPIAADGNFTFVAPVNAGASYAVSVGAYPSSPAQDCTITNDTGTANANVNNVAVTCVVMPMTITSSTPATGAVSVTRGIVPAVTFSAMLDDATVPGHVTLKRGTHLVPATFAAIADTVTITPQSPLSLLTTYAVAADTALSGLYGEPTAANSSIAFTTRDGVWHPAEIAKVNASNTSDVQVAVTPDGNAVAVWHEYNGVNANVWANVFTLGTGWGTAQQLQVSNTSDEVDPRIAVNAQGDAAVVWSQNNGVRSDIWYRPYTAGNGWGTATQLSASNVGLANYSPQVAMNADGDAVFSWTNNDGGDYAAWARYMAANGAMGAAARIESATGGTGEVKLAIDAAGNATALWANHDSFNNTVDLWANTYSNGSWGAGAIIESSAQSVSEFSVTTNSAGVVLAAWTQQITGSSQGVYVSRYDAGGGWSAATTLATTTNSSAYYPQVAADADGNALIVWGQYDGSTLNAYSIYYVAGGAWGAPVLTTLGVGSKIAFDASGNALAMWGEEVNFLNRVVKASRFTVTDGWGSPVVLTPGTTVFAQYPQFGIDAFGGAIAVWIDYNVNNGSSNIVSSRFDDTPVIQ